RRTPQPAIYSRGDRLQLHCLADAVANGGAKRQLGGDEVFDCVTHRLVDRDLVRRVAARAVAVQHLAELGAECGIKTLQLVAPGRSRLEGEPRLDEEPAALE